MPYLSPMKTLMKHGVLTLLGILLGLYAAAWIGTNPSGTILLIILIFLATNLIGGFLWKLQRRLSERHSRTGHVSEVHLVNKFRPDARSDVIFVHGLGGNWQSTWAADAKRNETFWPGWLADQLPRVNVWSL